MPETNLTVAIVGGGVGGLAVALGLERAGRSCAVYEEADGLRLSGAAVTMWPNGVAALARLGLPTHGMGRRLGRLETRSAEGRVLNVIDTERLARRFGVPMLVVPRKTLITRLAEAIVESPIRFGSRCVGVVENDQGVVIRFETDKPEHAAFVVAADGHRSVIRQKVFGGGPAHPTGWGESQGLVRLATPLTDGPVAVVAVDRSGACGLLPADDGVLQWWFAVPAGDAKGSPIAMLRARFGGWMEPIPTVLDALSEASMNYWPYARHRVPRSLVTSRIALVGDAAHAMPPTLGQGANQALEDAVALATAFASTGPNEALGAYSRRRRRRAAIVSRLAMRPPTQDTNARYTRITARVPTGLSTWAVGSFLRTVTSIPR